MDTIQDVLNDYFRSWNDGFKTKNDDAIRKYMSKSFKGYWAHSKISEPMEYDYSYDIVSVLKQYDDATKSFKPHSINERNAGNQLIITGSESSVINDVIHTAQCMFIWQIEDDGWKLFREYIELEK